MLIRAIKRAQLVLSVVVVHCLVSFNGAAAQDFDLSAVAVNVNGKVITLANIIAEVANLPPEYLDLSDEYLYNNLLDQLINKVLLAEMLQGEELSTKVLIENSIRSIKASQYIDMILLDVPKEIDLNVLYEETMANYSPENEYLASHILLDTKDEAEDISERIGEGENFAKLAAEFSTGPSASNGGSLGWFSTGQMVPEFEAAVLALEIGMVSRPIKTQFGWHIIKLDGERLQPQPTLSELRPQLEARLRQNFLDAQLEKLREDADINYFDTGVDKAIIKQIDLLFKK